MIISDLKEISSTLKNFKSCCTNSDFKLGYRCSEKFKTFLVMQGLFLFAPKFCDPILKSKVLFCRKIHALLHDANGFQ